MINTCSFILPNDEPCGELCEGKTETCATHNKFIRDEKKRFLKQSSKRAALLEKAKAKSQVKRKGISRNPKDWSNTFLCSDGTRVTQAEINEYRHEAYKKIYVEGMKCQGCGGRYLCFAHVIPQARCKQLGKTELIWKFGNFFPSCFACNSAIESPKSKYWKSLKNIEKCLSFIKQHDPELYAKLELSAVNQENPVI